MSKLNYEERLKNYETEKKELQQKGLSEFEYMRAIKALADKWDI